MHGSHGLLVTQLTGSLSSSLIQNSTTFDLLLAHRPGNHPKVHRPPPYHHQLLSNNPKHRNKPKNRTQQANLAFHKSQNSENRNSHPLFRTHRRPHHNPHPIHLHQRVPSHSHQVNASSTRGIFQDSPSYEIMPSPMIDKSYKMQRGCKNLRLIRSWS